MTIGETADASGTCISLLIDRRQSMLGLNVIGIELQDHFANSDRLHEKSALHVALNGAIVGSDCFGVLAKAAIHFRRALGPLRITRFEPLELEIRVEGALVRPGGRRSGRLLS